MTIDGKATPGKWAGSLALTGFLPYKKEGSDWRAGSPGLTRLHLAADKDNLYLLAAFMSVSTGGTLKFSVATGIDAKPAWVAIERATGKITSSVATEGMECKKCDDDPLLVMDPKDPFKVPSTTVYECLIPRKALGIDAAQTFLGNVESNGYWRGNPASGGDPVAFGRFIIGK
jgi:hypothetical protein